MPDRTAVIDSAVRSLINGTYKATGIKIELEANLRRAYYTQNRETCEDCDGDGYRRCPEDCYEGRLDCGECEGEGHIPHPQDEDETITCLQCDDGRIDCPFDCDEGTIDCETCDNRGFTSAEGAYDLSSEMGCHDFILSRLVDLGLAEEHAEGSRHSNKYRPVAPLIFSKFYNDGSVDSEWTFTLDIKSDPSVVHKLPEILDVFKQLANEVDQSFDTSGAGMHMALLNSEDCSYPIGVEDREYDRFRNWRKSMQPLLPALYFLGSPSNISRGLKYRMPQVESADLGGSKYSAVSFRGGALEFRVFETCYEDTNVVLDNVVVMANCMKYWSDNFIPTISADGIRFGSDHSNELTRFYTTEEHLDALNKGLALIKPKYMTVGECKKQRKFSVTKRTVKSLRKNQLMDIEKQYKEYEDRYEHSITVSRYYITYQLLDRLPSSDTEDVTRAEQEAESRARESQPSKVALDEFTKQQIKKIEDQLKGKYLLVQ